MKVLCIGSAVMDIMGYPIGQEKGWKEKQRIESIRIWPGGDAVNQSIHLARLGMEPALAACIGDDANGQILKRTLYAEGVDVSKIIQKQNCGTGTALVLVSERGERRIFSTRGAHSGISKEDIPQELPSECQAVSLASLFSMPILEQDGLQEYLCRQRAEGKLIFADLAADKLGLGLDGIRGFLPYIDYFLPSCYDVLEMTGTASEREAAEVFLSLGAKHVIIKCGEKGCYCLDEEYDGFIPAIPVSAVDTTGAGDCMVAVFISRILQGDETAAACRLACGAASCSTQFPGATGMVLSHEKIREIQNFIKS